MQLIDLHFQQAGTISAFLVYSNSGPILIESGPHSTYPRLIAALAELGLEPGDLAGVLLTHIHFDHAGAAWALAREGVPIYVHPVGAPHLQSPERLYGSAKRIYGDQMEPLWGVMEPIDPSMLVAVEDRQLVEIGGQRFVAHHTPGHAKHHIAWQLDDRLFTGDVAGARLGQGPVSPPFPPPDIDIVAWRASLDRIEEIHPRVLCLTHFGEREDVLEHIRLLKAEMLAWARWIEPRWRAGEDAETITPAFAAWATDRLRAAGVSAEVDLTAYEAANPAWMSVAGLLRWWTKHSDGVDLDALLG